jgi:hypothetical protein
MREVFVGLVFPWIIERWISEYPLICRLPYPGTYNIIHLKNDSNPLAKLAGCPRAIMIGLMNHQTTSIGITQI